MRRMGCRSVAEIVGGWGKVIVRNEDPDLGPGGHHRCGPEWAQAVAAA